MAAAGGVAHTMALCTNRTTSLFKSEAAACPALTYSGRVATENAAPLEGCCMPRVLRGNGPAHCAVQPLRFYRCYSPSCAAIDPYTDKRGALGTLSSWMPGDTSFYPELIYSIYDQAALRADAAGSGEGPGDDPDDDEDDGPPPFPQAVAAACRRDILSVMNRFFATRRAEPFPQRRMSAHLAGPA